MIDRDHLTRQTAQDVVLQRDILTLFAEQLQDLDHHLQQAEAAGCGTAASLGHALHKSRGAASAVGATALVAGLAAAEARLVSGGLPADASASLRHLVRATLTEARGLIAALRDPGLAKDGESH